ncbi:mevalonate kinase [Ferroglobus sp.]|uniref:mevalonate kinase n=1 Tax=Ferroglobus sp. TaxID=2614230 RepID=UPI0025BF83B7|nr:mevalonate kinase [Ferroglobus sp.]
MISSAPGKVIIFGEHAVVYKRRALASAINLRCYVKAEKKDDVEIHSDFGKTGLDFNVHPFISQSILNFKEVTDFKGVKIEVRSKIPPASGLGSSAAVTVATLTALNELFSTSLTKDEIFELARKVELDVQGRGSGTDPFISTFGGAWIFPERKRVDPKITKLFVYDTKKRSITAEMVAGVAERREVFPEIFEKIFDAIDAITLKGAKLFERGEVEKLERLFFINQRLLSAIGVSTPEIDAFVADLERRGVSAKITGAGGGGCLISLKPFEGAFEVKINEEGARIEDFEDWRFFDN